MQLVGSDGSTLEQDEEQSRILPKESVPAKRGRNSLKSRTEYSRTWGRSNQFASYKRNSRRGELSTTQLVEGVTSLEKMLEYVVDLQGFQRVPNNFVFKEIAVLGLQDSALPLVFKFQPPTDWSNLLDEEKSTAKWLEKSYHGIPWGSGNIPYARVGEVVRMTLFGASFIYVKGREKKHWLELMIPERPIIDLESMGCPSLKDMRKNSDAVLCANHKLCKINPVCAVKNAFALRQWLKTQKQCLSQADGIDEVDYPRGSSTPFDSRFRTKDSSAELYLTMYN